MALSFQQTGNCNFQYVTYLKWHWPNMLDALVEIIVTPADGYYSRKPKRRYISSAILLFAQGSEDSVETCGYAPALAALIEQYKLGSVVSSGPAPNPLHGNKPGILYMWVMDHDAIENWYRTYIDAETGKFVTPEQKAEQEKRKAEEAARKIEHAKMVDQMKIQPPLYDNADLDAFIQREFAMRDYYYNPHIPKARVVKRARQDTDFLNLGDDIPW